MVKYVSIIWSNQMRRVFVVVGTLIEKINRKKSNRMGGIAEWIRSKCIFIVVWFEYKEAPTSISLSMKKEEWGWKVGHYRPIYGFNLGKACNSPCRWSITADTPPQPWYLDGNLYQFMVTHVRRTHCYLIVLRHSIRLRTV